MFLGNWHGIGHVVTVSMRQQHVLNLFRKLEVFGVFGIVFDEGINQDVCAFRGLDEYGGMSKPGDARAFQ